MPGTRLAFNEAHGVNIPKSKQAIQPDSSLIQRLDTAGLHHKTDAECYLHVSKQAVTAAKSPLLHFQLLL